MGKQDLDTEWNCSEADQKEMELREEVRSWVRGREGGNETEGERGLVIQRERRRESGGGKRCSVRFLEAGFSLAEISSRGSRGPLPAKPAAVPSSKL